MAICHWTGVHMHTSLGLPSIVRIGVIGHRHLPDVHGVREAARTLFGQIHTTLSSLTPHGGYRLVLLSNLAEGADRVLVDEGLAVDKTRNYGTARCVSILPLAPDEYQRDFASEASRSEFQNMLDASVYQHVVPPAESREQAYAEAARFLIDNCDILIAVWNRQATAHAAGTAPAVEYARSVGRHLFIIDSCQPPQISEMRQRDQTAAYLSRIQATEQFNRTVDASKLKPSQNEGTASFIERHLSYADHAAQEVGDKSRFAANAIHVLSAVAVLVVSAQLLFLPSSHGLLWLEIVCMAGILLLSYRAIRSVWQQRWAEYRFLAERLRAMTHLAKVPACLRKEIVAGREWFINKRTEDWIGLTLDWLWSELPATPAPGNDPVVEIRTNWIDSQAEYYERRSQALASREKVARLLSHGLFVVTAIAALLHVFITQPAILHMLTFLAIACPTIGAAVAGLQAHHETLRLSVRYEQCAQQLRQISKNLARTSSPEAAASHIATANQVMLAEQSDWRISVHTKELGPK